MHAEFILAPGSLVQLSANTYAFSLSRDPGQIRAGDQFVVCGCFLGDYLRA